MSPPAKKKQINVCIKQYFKVDHARAAPVPLSDKVELHSPYSDIDNDNFINLKIYITCQIS